MAAQIDTKLWNLEDMLRHLGFQPEEHGPREWDERWFIRQAREGTQNVRVVIFPNDGHRVDVYYLDRHFVAEWDARFSGSTPHSVIRTSIRAMVTN